MPRWRFDSTVNLGHIISLIVILLGMWAGFASIRERLTVIETKIEPLWTQYNNRIRVADQVR